MRTTDSRHVTSGRFRPGCYSDRVLHPLRRTAALRGLIVGTVFLVLGSLVTVPAQALGETGPFALPLETTSVAVGPSMVTRIPLTALTDDDADPELVLDQARLVVPDGIDAAQKKRITPAEDARSLAIASEGTWSLIGTDLIFTPDIGASEATTPIALQIPGNGGSLSEPAQITVSTLKAADAQVRATAGEKALVPLPGKPPSGGSVQLQLDSQTPGTTLSETGDRMAVPEQGMWQVSADGSGIGFIPVSARLGQQPDIVSYLVRDARGLPVAAGRAQVTLPIISDVYRSAPYGQPIVLSVGEAQQYVDPATLRLEPPEGEDGMTVADGGTTVTVPGQGVWTLDRSTATVTFQPDSADVRFASPMMITGTDTDGNEAAPGLLSTAYPLLVDRIEAGTPGTDVVFDLSDGSLEVSPETVRFDPERLPEGAQLSEDGLRVDVPDQGVWTINAEARTVTMAPTGSLMGAASPVGITAQGVYADSTARSELTAVITSAVPTMRDDEVRTAPDTSVVVEPLANDTAASADKPLRPETLELQSLQATNLAELDGGAGQRIVIAGEGVYTVGSGGAVTFTPADGFVGTTTSIDYVVRDTEGVPSRSRLQVTVDPTVSPTTAQRTDSRIGINTLLAGILPGAPTALTYGTIVMLLISAGVASLWIGHRMGADRSDLSD